ncbi:proton-conducting transporter transmembrane domain-containing protein [Tranquillimonas alkanivorans]|uniref:Probable inorganic carbon transporter subunit DabB n=1 Tax=Tranquillimonas alkanivorans TaxID=441119 RepID=A0A1I5Q4S5_9RHOB|nr:proton-conducting transporter membrane subunit [Tranquillimonas alkanivorans]SFP40886.1 NAD(P)H-quinone oxidoreductase subunit 5 [Tranquillimonas alkanivorans]
MSNLLLLGPLALAMAALATTLFPPRRADGRLHLPEIAALAALASGVLAAAELTMSGPSTGALFGATGIGFSARLDIVSVAMTLTVAFVGWVVLRFSRVALDGEARQPAFMAWISATVACVLLLVSAGNLVQLAVGWVATGAALHNLLLFYPDRPRARRVALKKAMSGGIASAALLAAVGLLAVGFGTTDIAAINAAALAGQRPDLLWLAALLLAIAAVFKSALVPTHGWLTEVMEAPTPVSALLHAGVVNAGGFLLIRFADVLLATPGVLAVLALVGGFSALVAAAVALTQPAVKTALAWSTCAQMGFMVLQCGLALFPLALLHIVAHSLYKAHAFLASGGAVREVTSIRRPGPVAVPGLSAVARAFGLALVLYLLVGLAFGIASKPPQTVALGAILIFGVVYLIAQGLADRAPRALAWRTVALSVAAAVAYFALQQVATWTSAGTLPQPPAPDGLMWATIVLAVVSFGVAAVAQTTFPLWAGHPAAAGLRVHLMNGLYLNAVTDRLSGRWTSRKGATQ